MTDRAVAEAGFDAEVAAHRVYTAAVAEAARVRKEGSNAAYRRRDEQFDALRDRRQQLLSTKPRTDAVTAEIAAVEAAMREHRANPPPVDLTEIEARYKFATDEAMSIYSAERKRIHRAVMTGGNPQPQPLSMEAL